MKQQEKYPLRHVKAIFIGKFRTATKCCNISDSTRFSLCQTPPCPKDILLFFFCFCFEDLNLEIDIQKRIYIHFAETQDFTVKIYCQSTFLRTQDRGNIFFQACMTYNHNENVTSFPCRSCNDFKGNSPSLIR